MEGIENKPDLTWLAIPICFVLIVPGYLIGGVLKLFYLGWLGYFSDDGTILHWIGLESIGNFLQSLFYSIIPEGLQGVVAGGIASLATFKIFRNADRKVVIYSTSALFIFLVVFLISLVSFQSNSFFNFSNIAVISGTIGTVAGLNYGRVESHS